MPRKSIGEILLESLGEALQAAVAVPILALAVAFSLIIVGTLSALQYLVVLAVLDPDLRWLGVAILFVEAVMIVVFVKTFLTKMRNRDE